MKLIPFLSQLSDISKYLLIIFAVVLLGYLIYLIKVIIDLLKVVNLRMHEIEKTIELGNEISANTLSISNSGKNISESVASFVSSILRFVSKSTVDTSAFLMKLIKERNLLKKVRGEE